MLASGQVNREALAGALAEAFCGRLLRLGQALLEASGSPAGEAALTAQRMAEEGLAAALLNVYRYQSDRSRSEAGVEAWFYPLALPALLSEPGPHDGGGPFPDSTLRPEKEAVFRRLRELDGQMRLAVLLAGLLEWEPGRIAAALETPGPAWERQLAIVLDQLAWMLENGKQLAQGERTPSWSRLKRLLQARWPERSLSPADIEEVARKAAARAAGDEARQARVARLREAALVGAAILAVALSFWGANLLFPEPEFTPPPARSPIPEERAERTPLSTPRPFTPRLPLNLPTFTPAPPVMFSYYTRSGETLEEVAARFGLPAERLARLNGLPLGMSLPEEQPVRIFAYDLPSFAGPPSGSTPAEPHTAWSEKDGADGLFRRVYGENRAWTDLWADVQLIRYGPSGYLGRPLITRAQVWVSQPDRSRAMLGLLAGGPASVQVQVGGLTYAVSLLQNRRTILPDQPLLADPELRGLIFPTAEEWMRSERLNLLGEGQAAGRRAVIFEWENPERSLHLRLWADAETGLILRQIRLDPQDEQIVLEEALVSRILYDEDFPAEIFSPRREWRGGFAADQHGRAEPPGALPPGFEPPTGRDGEPLPPAAPPEGFDPAGSPLAFLYPPEYDPGAPVQTGEPQVYVIAGGYALGRLPFANPFAVVCARSPDGRRVAFSPQPLPLADTDFYLEETPRLYWFNLDRVIQLNYASQPIEAHLLAFAPDSRQLAVAGWNFSLMNVGGPYGVFLIDTDTGEQRNVARMEEVFGLGWSPDGRTLAWAGRAPGREAEWFTAEAAGREIFYRAPFEPQLEGPPAGSPLEDWGIAIPAEPADLAGCARLSP